MPARNQLKLIQHNLFATAAQSEPILSQRSLLSRFKLYPHLQCCAEVMPMINLPDHKTCSVLQLPLTT